MHGARGHPPADTTENWDDDFEFQPQLGRPRRRRTNEPPTPVAPSPLTKDKSNELAWWSEPGPSTPSKQRHVELETENWDDDFQDSPASRRVAPTAALDASPLSSRRSRRYHRRSVTDPDAEPVENWDEEFQQHDTGRGQMSLSSRRSTTWDSSDEELELGLGFNGAERDEDRTVTSRPRYGAFTNTSSPGHTPPPPVPPIPSMFMAGAHDPAPFPRSPTASVFSVPISGRDSVAGHSYSSTAHLALRPTLSGSSLGHPMNPPTPPTQHSRERRRLRKKSRPAHVEPNIYELEDIPPSVPRPTTPDRPTRTSPPSAAPGVAPLDDPDPGVSDPVTPPSATKSSLASRIGSVGKKWGAAKKKRASMGAADSSASGSGQSRPQSVALPSSSSPPVSRATWFFRHGGAANTEAGSGSPPALPLPLPPTTTTTAHSHNAMTLPLRHEKSVDRLLALIGDTPSRRRNKVRQGLPVDLTNEEREGEGRSSSTRRPSSMYFSSSSRPEGMRHGSYGEQSVGGGRSRSSSASASVDDVSSSNNGHNLYQLFRTPRKGRQSAEHDRPGYRSFMGGVRRLSLQSGSGHGHKAKQPSGSSSRASKDKERTRPSTSTAATAVPYLLASTEDVASDTTPKPPSRAMQRSLMDKPLLPPIELQPPSPPRTLSSCGIPSSKSEPLPLPPLPTPTLPPSEIDALLSPLPTSTSSPLPTTNKQPGSPQQSASLGRSTHPPPKDKEEAVAAVPRRNSLGDLKIPARISQAQIGLRRDLGLVREFAASVEQLRELRATRDALTLDVQTLLLETAPSDEPGSRATSPTLFGMPRHGRARSNTNPQASSASGAAVLHRQLSTTYRSIEAKYAISWECAELLVELGGGPPPDPPPPPPSTSVSASMEQSQSTITPSTTHAHAHPDVRKSRERAVTLGGDEPKPQIALRAIEPSPSSPSSPGQWRASTGRHDLSHRQLLLLRDMLQTSTDTSRSTSTHARISEEAVDRSWHWGVSSVITLPSEEEGESRQGSIPGSSGGQDGCLKKRKSTRLGLRGLRDMLKSLRKTVSQNHVRDAPLVHSPLRGVPLPASSTSVALTESSMGVSQERPQSAVHRRRARTGPEIVQSLRDSHPNNPYVTSASVGHHRLSPRRPSLASIFRLGHKSSKSSKSTPQSTSGQDLSGHDDRAGSNSSCHVSSVHTEEEEEGWDKIESLTDLPLPADGVPSLPPVTVRGVKGRSPHFTELPLDTPVTPGKPMANASRSSIWETGSLHSPSSASVSQAYLRTTKLSDVKEFVEKEGGGHQQQQQHRRKLSKSRRHSTQWPSVSPGRPASRGGRKNVSTSDSLRSPPSTALSSPSYHHLPELDQVHPGFDESPLSLAMTPENIRPLLENAKEVYAQCSDCIVELKQLLSVRTTVVVASAT
ncbi:hypothetical protein BDY19DRAFT_992677 [Irpex rosettiformis]|uniref:Uncharacterized protein n=1 Tax=Irpex rosettiformis TaxID=378272 RepID=A0ACB8U5Q4_9APHY|nr:hypothetical protein BDY19DRAFT_992677 [Irpex rosettiformis]